MDAAREDASGTPLLNQRQKEIVIDMDQSLTSVTEEPEEPIGSRTVFTKKKLSLSRNIPLKPIILPQSPMHTKNTHLFTPQANSPLRQFSQHTSTQFGSAEGIRSNITIRIFLPRLFKEEQADKEAYTCVSIEVNRFANAEEVINQLAVTLALGSNQADASKAFAIWMISPLLELQLKPHHQPLELRKTWSALLAKFAADATLQERTNDKPLLFIKRLVQLSANKEAELAEIPGILNLLFDDAKYNLFADRYYMTPCNAAELAGLGYAIEGLGELTIDYIKKNLEGQLPDYLANTIRGPMMFGKSLSNCRELDTILSTWKRNKDMDNKHLKKMYLKKLHESCQQYGSAFFHGFIERPSVSPLKNLKRFFQSVAAGDADMPVTIGVNREMISVIDDEKHEIILMIPISDCTWKKVTWEGTAASEDVECENNEPTQPMLLLHFPQIDIEPGSEPRTNVLQIFGSQTIFIHSLLENMKDLHKRDLNSEPNSASSTSSSGSEKEVKRTPSLTKCDRMCLATFVNGKCVKASGSMKKIMNKMQAVH